MAKIRGIKPETWTDEKIVSVSPLARLLFIGMWNFACDNGHLDDSPVQLKMRILPADNCDAAELVTELVDAGLVAREHGYLKVPNLPSHQKIDLRYLTLCAHCDNDGDTALKPSDKTGSPSRPKAKPNGHTSGARRDHAVHTVGSHVDGDGDGEGDGEGEKKEPSSSAAPLTIREVDPYLFTEFWEQYPRKVGKDAARTAWAKALRRTNADAIIKAAGRMARDPNLPEPQYIPHPATWLHRGGWDDEPYPARNGNRKPTTDDKVRDALALSDRLAAREQRTPKEIARWTPPTPRKS